MQHVNFSEKPEAVTFQEFKDLTLVTITVNIEEVKNEITSGDDEQTVHWEGGQVKFWEESEFLDKEAIIANPEDFVNYAPIKYKNEAKDKAQAHLDSIRKIIKRVDVPTYKEGYAVMYRPEDKIYLLAGMEMGGLPCYEFADGQVVAPLTTEDIAKIYSDLAAHEVTLQQGKQYCWSLIDAAKTVEEVDFIINSYINS